MKKTLKKIIAGISVVSMCLAAAPLNISAATTYYRGDINGSGTVDIQDTAAMSQYLHGIKSANGVTAERLDLNRDYVIDINDSQMLNKILLGEISGGTVSSVNTSMSATQGTKYYYKYNSQTGVLQATYSLSSVPNISSYPASTYIDGIIGGDDRVPDYSKSSVVRLSSGGTGVVVGTHTILTSAKNVYDVHTNDAIGDLKYTLYNTNGTEAGTYSAVSTHVPKVYIDNSNEDSYIGDYALITVNENLNNYACYSVGVCRDNLKNLNPDVYVTGYSTSGTVGMVTSSGKFTGNKISSEYLFYNVDAIESERGAPVYVKDSNGNMIVIGINSTNPNTLMNTGKRIDTNVLHFIYNNPNL